MAQICSVYASIPSRTLRHWRRRHASWLSIHLPQELDAHGVCEQIQATSAWTGVHLNLQPLRMLKSPRAFNAVLYDFEFMVRQALLAPARFTHPVGPSQLSAGVMQQRPAVVILHIVFFRGDRGSTMSGN